MRRIPHLALAAAISLALPACIGSVKVEPVTVQPIHITIDVNLRDVAQPAKR